MLTGKDLGVSGASSRRNFRRSARSSPSSRPQSPRHAGLYRRPVCRQHRPRFPAISAATGSGPQYDPFATGGDPNAKTFRVENLALTRGLTIDRLNDRRSLMRAPGPGAADARRPGPLRHARQVRRRRLRVRQRQAGPRRLRHQPRKCTKPATPTAATRGASRHCWPAGSSRRERRSSRCIWGAGTITGTCSRAWSTSCRWSIRCCRAC